MFDSDDRVDRLENFQFMRPSDKHQIENVVRKKNEYILNEQDILVNIEIKLQSIVYDDECYFYILYLLSDQLRTWFKKNKSHMIQNENKLEAYRNIQLLYKYQSILMDHFLNHFDYFIEFQKNSKFQCDLFEVITAHFFLMQLYVNILSNDCNQIISDYHKKIMKFCELNFQFLDVQIKYNESLFIYFYNYLTAVKQQNKIIDDTFKIFKLIQKYFFHDQYYLNQLFAIDTQQCNILELILYHLQNKQKELEKEANKQQQQNYQEKQIYIQKDNREKEKQEEEVKKRKREYLRIYKQIQIIIETFVEKYRSYPEFNKYLITIIESKNIQLQTIMYNKIIKQNTLVSFFDQNCTNINLIKSFYYKESEIIQIASEKEKLMKKQIVQMKFLEWHLNGQFQEKDLNSELIKQQFESSLVILGIDQSQIIKNSPTELKASDIDDLVKTIINQNLNSDKPSQLRIFNQFILNYIKAQIQQDTYKVMSLLAQVIELSFYSKILTDEQLTNKLPDKDINFSTMVSKLQVNQKFYVYSKILGCINNSDKADLKWIEELFTKNHLINKISLQSTTHISNIMFQTKSTNNSMNISKSIYDIEGQLETQQQQQTCMVDEDFFSFLDNLIYFIRNKNVQSYRLLEILWILVNNIRIASIPQQSRDQYGQKMLLIAYSILDSLQNTDETKQFRMLIFQKSQGLISFYNYDIFDQQFITQIQLYCLQILFYKVEKQKEIMEILDSLSQFLQTNDIIDFREQTNLLILLLSIQTNGDIINKVAELIYLQLEKHPHIQNIKTILRVLSKYKILVSRLLLKESEDNRSELQDSKIKYDKFAVENSIIEPQLLKVKYQLTTANSLDQTLNLTTYINMKEEQIKKSFFNESALVQLESILQNLLSLIIKSQPQPTMEQHIIFRQYSNAVIKQNTYLTFPFNVLICGKFNFFSQIITLMQIKFDSVEIQVQLRIIQNTNLVQFYATIKLAKNTIIFEFFPPNQSQNLDIICISLDKSYFQIRFNSSEHGESIPSQDIKVLKEILIGNHNSQTFTYLCQTDMFKVDKQKFAIYRFYAYVGEFKDQFKSFQDIDQFGKSNQSNIIIQMAKRIPQYQTDLLDKEEKMMKRSICDIFQSRNHEKLKHDIDAQGIVINYYNCDGLHESKNKFSVFLSVIQFTQNRDILDICQQGILQNLEFNYKYLIQNINSYRTFIKNNNNSKTYDYMEQIYLQLSRYSLIYATKFNRATMQDLSLYHNIDQITQITQRTLKLKIDFVDLIIMISRFQNLLDQESQFFEIIFQYFCSLPSQQKNYDLMVDYLKLIKFKCPLQNFLRIITKITEKVQIKQLQIKQKLDSILDSVLPKFKSNSCKFHFCDIFDLLIDLLILFNKKDISLQDMLIQYVTFLPLIYINQIRQLFNDKLPLGNFIRNYLRKKLQFPQKIIDNETKIVAQEISIKLVERIFDKNNIDEMTIGIIFDFTIFFNKFQFANPIQNSVLEIFNNFVQKFQCSYLDIQYFQTNFDYAYDSIIVQELVRNIQTVIADNKKENQYLLYNVYQFLQYYEYIILKNQDIIEQPKLYLQLLSQIIILFYSNSLFHNNLIKFIQPGDVINMEHSQNFMIPGGALRLILSIIIQSNISIELLAIMELLREKVKLTRKLKFEIPKQTKKFLEKFNQYNIQEYSNLKYNFLHIECIYFVYLNSQNNKPMEKIIQDKINMYKQIIDIPKNYIIVQKYRELISQFSKSQIELTNLAKFNLFSQKLQEVKPKQQYLENEPLEYIVNVYAMMPLKVTQSMILEVFQKKKSLIQKQKRSIVIQAEEISHLEGIFKTKIMRKNNDLQFINEKISKQSLEEAEGLFNNMETIQLKLVQESKFDYFFRFIYKQQYKLSNQAEVQQNDSVKLSDYFISYYQPSYTIQTKLIYFDKKLDSYILLGTKSIIIEQQDTNHIIKHKTIKYISINQKHLHLLTCRKLCAIFNEYLIELPSKEKGEVFIQYCKSYNIKIIKDSQKEFKNSSLQKEWHLSQITNFQFINQVNLYAQRSYLYFNKYRIFPQILKHPELKQTVFRNYKNEDQRTQLQWFGIQTSNKIQIVNKLFFQSEIYNNPNMYELFQQFFCQPEFFHGVRVFPKWVRSQTSHEYVYRMKLFLEDWEASQHLNKWLNMHFGENSEISLGEFQDKQQNDKFCIKEPKLYWDDVQFLLKRPENDGNLKGLHLISRKSIILISVQMITKITLMDSVFHLRIRTDEVYQFSIEGQIQNGFLYLVLEVGQALFQDKVQSPYHVLDEYHKVDRLLVLVSSESDFNLRCYDITKNKKRPPMILEYHQDFITCFKYVQYYQMLIVGSDDTKISLWKLELDQNNIFPQQPIQIILSHNCQIKCLDANKSFILSVDVLNNAHISTYDGEQLFRIQIKSLQTTVFCHIHDFANQFIFITSYGTLITYGYYGAVYIKEYQLCQDVNHIVFLNPFISQFYYFYDNKIYYNDLFEIAAAQNGVLLNEDSLQLKIFEKTELQNIAFTQIIIDPKITKLDAYCMLVATNDSVYILKDMSLIQKLINQNLKQAGLLMDQSL
ncbi:hypothetical protein pb186bvf_002320 [Paramecium bursaria]